MLLGDRLWQRLFDWRSLPDHHVAAAHGAGNRTAEDRDRCHGQHGFSRRQRSCQRRDVHRPSYRRSAAPPRRSGGAGRQRLRKRAYPAQLPHQRTAPGRRQFQRPGGPQPAGFNGRQLHGLRAGAGEPAPLQRGRAYLGAHLHSLVGIWGASPRRTRLSPRLPF